MPYLFPTSLVDPNLTRERSVSFNKAFKYLINYKDDRFTSYYRFKFVSSNISIRKKARGTSIYFLKSHPDST